LIGELAQPVEFSTVAPTCSKVERPYRQATGAEASLHLEPSMRSATTSPIWCSSNDRSCPTASRSACSSRVWKARSPGHARDAVYTVTEVYPTHVVLDGNHPLAGVALRLHLTVQDVRQATSDEIDAGSVGQPAFSVFNADPPGPHLH
jgi:FKBP-type peptidyl-prolyl cis-trans isomerase SlyD